MVLTLVLGGTRSGKSAVAERLLAGRSHVTYIATGVVGDDRDFADRVAAHQTRRPSTWTTVEAGSDLVGTVKSLSDGGSALIDSLGTWVAAHADLEVDVDALVSALTASTADLVIVSEEVGLGVHPPTEVGRRFCDLLGAVNQAVAAVADTVLLVVAGRVLELD